MRRRDFVVRVGGAAVAVPVALKLAACGGGGDDDDDDNGGAGADASPPDCTANGARGTITANHGHNLFVPAGDIAAGVQKDYDISGSSGHPHTITLTAEHFTSLAAGESVSVQSTVDASHSHMVTVSCL